MFVECALPSGKKERELLYIALQITGHCSVLTLMSFQTCKTFVHLQLN